MPPFPAELPRLHVEIAGIRSATEPTVLETVLGSCVAAVFWSPRLRIGAMCHGALPVCPRALLDAGDAKPCLRYVDFAIRYLAEQFSTMGAGRRELQVKLFGGADVLPVAKGRVQATIGSQNRKIAMRVLTEEGLTLSAFDLGGELGRAIYFRTDTGEVLLRRLRMSATQTRGGGVTSRRLKNEVLV